MRNSPLFSPLRLLLDKFSAFERWPTLLEMQSVLDGWPDRIDSGAGVPIRLVEQSGKPTHLEAHYAPRIHTHGEIQTRRDNWHDFFNFLTWPMFPKTKALINALHFEQAQARVASGGEAGARGKVEDTLTLFDEGGAVLVASKPELLELVRGFSWKELFWQRRGDVETSFECLMFGHALYEKALVPYVGMTANCILLACEPSFHGLSWPQKWAWVDAQLVSLFGQGEILTSPRNLQPFPLLGMPGWDEANARAEYYDNTRYFRPGRRRDRAS